MRLTQGITVVIGLCVAASLLLNVERVQAATLDAQTGIAGISLTLDQQALQQTQESGSTGLETAGLNAVLTAAQIIPESEYANVGISIADPYVNVRQEPNTDSKILGKLYEGAAATIIEDDGEWVEISSGKVKGYINSGYLAIGFDAEELVDKYAAKYATVTTETLRVRTEKSVDATVLTLIPYGETYEVVKEYDEWVEVIIDEDIQGYISKEYTDIAVEFEEAISIEEEQAKIKAAEEAKRAEAEALRKLQEAQNRQKSQSMNNSNSSSKKMESEEVTSTDGDSAKGSEIADYALKFKGNPYVFGGTSLTKGTDCSGFVQSIYKSFGYSIPRDSRSQASGAGKKVSLSSLQSGDLIFYTNNGRVNHVALYIGNNQVIHASSPKSGIKISSMNYRTPYMARRILND